MKRIAGQAKPNYYLSIDQAQKPLKVADSRQMSRGYSA